MAVFVFVVCRVSVGCVTAYNIHGRGVELGVMCWHKAMAALSFPT